MAGPIVTALMGGVMGVVGKVVERVVVDKNEQAKIKAETEREIQRALIQGELAQLDINKLEAQNPNLFVSGWRPFIGWVCGSALAYQFVLAPISMWAATWAGLNVPMPPMLDDVLWQLVFGMLGMGTLRTAEKWKGVAR